MYQPFEVDVWLILRSDTPIIFLFRCSVMFFHVYTAFLGLVYHKIVEIARLWWEIGVGVVKSFSDMLTSSA